MVITRFRPGDLPFTHGLYELVGHYGERTGRTSDNEEGEVLPSGLHEANGSQIEEPLWYVRSDDLQSGRAAA